MPPKLGSLKPRQVVRALQKAGFYIHEQVGSHIQLKHRSKPGRITVPCHERFDLPKHVVKSIIRQAGLSNQQFLDLLQE
jgi:predicted RNA binding protein YcfA (HicA-like mRNA interferase family)